MMAANSGNPLRDRLTRILSQLEATRMSVEHPSIWADDFAPRSPEPLNDAIYTLQRMLDFGEVP